MESITSILDLNDYCKLKIIKYIISDCELRDESQSNIIKYSDLVSFALAHEDLEAVLELYHNDLYKALEFLFVTNRDELSIDFAQLQSIHTGKAGDAFWQFFADAIRENGVIEKVILLYSPQSFQPDFLDNFQMIKRALENKESLYIVQIDITGYSLDDLNFGHITALWLRVRVSAEALATICKSNPHLTELFIMSTDILGRLSDIVPHCRNLVELDFVAKPDVDLAEYAPLAQLPNLSEMTIHGAFKNGSMLTMFEAMQKCQKPENEYLVIVLADELPTLSSVTLPRKDLLKTLRTHYKDSSHMSVLLEARYDCRELTANVDRAEKLYATFTLIEGVDFSIKYGERKLELSFLASRATELASLIKALNVEYLDLRCSEENSQAQLAKLFGLLHPEGSFRLRKLDIDGQALDQCGTSGLVKIQSLQELNCTFADWESFKHLSKLCNLQKIEISVREGGHLFVSNGKGRLSLKRYMASMASELASLIKVFNVNDLDLLCSEENSQAQLVKLFGLLHPEGSFALRKLHIDGQALDQFGTSELVKIQSLRVLKCTFTDWESFKHLSKLTNLRKIEISVGEAVTFFVSMDYRRLSLKRYIASMASELASLMKVLYVDYLDLRCSEENSQAQLAKLFTLLHPEGSFALRKLDIDNQVLDQFGTSELVKIQSLQELNCTFADSESFEHLSKLTNLQEIEISVEEQLDERSLQALCNFLSNCHGNLHGHIEYRSNCLVRLNENQISLCNESALCSAENTLGRQALSYLQRNLSNSFKIINKIFKYEKRCRQQLSATSWINAIIEYEFING